MEYSDNPRKVYGKVEIVYSDKEISSNMGITVSGNSKISHPREVFEGYVSPTVRACTMDGNSDMSGSYQMVDDTCIVGWWSGGLCGTGGVFEVKPYIELSFVLRPIISWIIRGDDKLNQYPVDFTIEYKSNGEIVHTEEITGNSAIEIKLEPKVNDITSIRMTIAKWSTPNACAKIIQFYDKLYEEYTGDAMQMFEVNEEMCSTDGNYNINSDTMTVTLHNTDRKFDKGYLRSLMILGRKVQPSIGIEKDGKVMYTRLGTFYSEEWQVEQDSQWVKCTAVDRLMRLQSQTYMGYPLTEQVSVYDLARDILLKSGHSENEFEISVDLKDMVIGLAYLPKTMVWDALQEIANAALCKIFVDREDRIHVRSEQAETEQVGIEINPSNMFSYKSSITLTEFANSIKVEYTDVEIADDIIEVAELEITLAGNEVREVSLDYSSDVAYAVILSSNVNVRAVMEQGGVNSCLLTLTNRTGTSQTTTLTVEGNAIELNSHTVVVEDEDSVNSYGTVEYSHTASELVQSESQARYIGGVILAKMRAGEGVITTEWRGNPALEIGASYSSTDRFGDKKELICEYNKFSYDGGLKQQTRGRLK
jgi:hypothetical protein